MTAGAIGSALTTKAALSVLRPDVPYSERPDDIYTLMFYHDEDFADYHYLLERPTREHIVLLAKSSEDVKALKVNRATVEGPRNYKAEWFVTPKGWKKQR